MILLVDQETRETEIRKVASTEAEPPHLYLFGKLPEGCEEQEDDFYTHHGMGD